MIIDQEIDSNLNNTFEKTNNSNVLNTEQWTKMVENWIEMVNTENNLNNNEVVVEETDDFEAGGHDIHPADNPLAKWNLLGLFNESLEAPIHIIQ